MYLRNIGGGVRLAYLPIDATYVESRQYNTNLLVSDYLAQKMRNEGNVKCDSHPCALSMLRSTCPNCTSGKLCTTYN
jgi:hypothetical protein